MTTLAPEGKSLPELPPVLADALAKLPADFRPEVVERIAKPGPSADWLADWFKRAGLPVGATTIKTYRRRCAERSPTC